MSEEIAFWLGTICLGIPIGMLIQEILLKFYGFRGIFDKELREKR